MTNAERSRRYREKLKENPKKYAERKRYIKEYNRKHRKRIADLDPEEIINVRKFWKFKKREQRRHKNALLSKS